MPFLKAGLFFAGVTMLSALLTLILRDHAGFFKLRAQTRTGGFMPLVGGVAVFLSVFLAFFFLYLENKEAMSSNFFLRPLVLIPFFLLGLFDDWKNFKALPKLLCFFLALAAAAWLYQGENYLWLFLAAAFFFSNSFNFLDNADAHLTSALLGIFLASAMLSPTVENRLFGFLFFAALLGFLFFNLPGRASAFLGDAGSLALGVAALLVVLGVASYEGGISFPIALTLLAFPIYDTFAVMTLRLWRGQNPTIGGQDHFSHRLMRAGVSLTLIDTATFLLCGPLAYILIKFFPGLGYFSSFIIFFLLLFTDLFFAGKTVNNPS